MSDIKTKLAGFLSISMGLATLVTVPVTAQTGPVFSASTSHGSSVSNSTGATSGGLIAGQLINYGQPNPSSYILQEYAAATSGGLHATARVTVDAPKSPGLGSAYFGNNGTARLIFDDFIISGPGSGSVPGSANFHLDGTIATGAILFGILGPGISSNISTSTTGSVAGNGFSGTFSQSKVINCCDANLKQIVTMDASGTGILGGSGTLPVNPTTPNFNLPVNAPFSVDVTLSANALAQYDIAGTAGGINAPSFNIDSISDFSNTLSFPLSGPVFNLPAGFTLNSVQAHIVNNHFSNSLDDPRFFVWQLYLDFLNRGPDQGGWDFWTSQITQCGSDQACIEAKRIGVSAAFYLSIEFQQTGYLVYRFYKASYGNLPGVPVPIKFSEFLPDTQQIGQGVVVGQTGWEQKLENNKQSFADDFVSRSHFTTTYPSTMTPAQFVDALFTNAGVAPSATERTAALNEFGSAITSAAVGARSQALRRVAENSTLQQQESNRAFVLMQYFGYLRRNPSDPPEPTLDFQGYNFWLNKLNQFNGNFINAEMVKAFLNSTEYRQRFGP
jgi:hypothetical protein